MRPRSRGHHALALAVAAAHGFAITGGCIERAAVAAPIAITVAAPAGSRLAEELKRELEISAFTVGQVVVAPDAGTGLDWWERAQQLVSAERPRVVALRADERQMVVLSRSESPDGIRASFDLQLDPEDRSTRRRACLAIVEYLRVLSEGDARAEARQIEPPAAEVGDQWPAAETDTAASTPPVQVPAVQVPAMLPVIDAPAVDDPSLAAHPQRAQPWTMGVGTTLDVSSVGGKPAGHLQFLWYFPLGTRLSLRTRVQWPVLGASFQVGASEVRMWTFGAAMGVQYSFTDPPSRWRPFLGLAVGNRIGLTEASSPVAPQSRTAITPSANLGLEGGTRYVLGSRAQIFGELEVTRDWLEPTTNRTDYERAAANAFSLHTSVGVLFEY